MVKLDKIYEVTEMDFEPAQILTISDKFVSFHINFFVNLLVGAQLDCNSESSCFESHMRLTSD